MLAMNSDMTM